MADKSFEELLFEGAMTAVRSLTLDQLLEHANSLEGMDLPEDVAEFPRIIIALVLAEKQKQLALN